MARAPRRTEDRLGEGEIPVQLEGKAYRLRPTLRAAVDVSDRFDGFIGAYARIQAYDVTAMAFIVAAGLGKHEPGSLGDVREAVVRTGAHELKRPLTRYVECLANGGREPDLAARDDEELTGKA